MQTQPIKTEFRRVRDFGEVFGTGFTFIRENFKPLALAVLYIGGPFLLVGSAVMTLILVRSSSLMPNPETGSGYGGSSFLIEFALSYMINILSLLAGAVMITAVINGYIKLYMESPDARPKIQVSEVWQQVKTDFWWLAGRFFLLTILVFVYFGAVIALGVLIFGSGSTLGLKILMGVVYVLGAVVLSMYLYTYFYAIFPSQSYFERTSFGESISRTFYLVKDNWWQTFGVVFVGGIIQSFVAGILYMPFYFILIFAGLFSTIEGGSGSPNTALMTFAGVGMSVGVALGYGLSFIIHFVLQAFQLHNLLERKESTGLLTKIESIGSVQSTSAAVDFYDEEEKY